MDMNTNMNKIPTNNKKLRRYKTVDDLPLSSISKSQQNASMLSSTDINISKNVNQAKVIKLKRLSNAEAIQPPAFSTSTPKTTTTLCKQTSDSFTSVSTLDDNNNNQQNIKKQNTLGLSKLYIIRDFAGSLIYGDLSVRQGEFVYLLCKSDSYFFVENQCGKYGFIPGEICVDLDELSVHAHHRSKCERQTKVTSF